MKINNDFDQQAIIDAFNRAASRYDGAAFLQREVADRLLDRLSVIKKQPQIILDLGSGTGYCHRQLRKRYPNAQIIALDIADEMLKFHRQQLSANSFLMQIKQKISAKKDFFICAAAQHLPLKSASFDLVISNLTIQWCDAYALLFAEIKRILKADGFFLFTSFGVDTLWQLKQSWQQISDEQHVNQFVDMHDIGDALFSGGWQNPVMDAEKIIIEYKEIKQLLRDLKQIGANNHRKQRHRGLLGKHQFHQLIQAYQKFQLENQNYPATYEVIYGLAWNQDLKLASSEPQKINLSSIKKMDSV